MRRADVRVKINDEETVINSGLYNRPVSVGGVLVDCPVTKGYNLGSGDDPWSLKKDVRLRVWPGNSPLTDPATFVYPINQVWHGSLTWFDNEPVDGGDTISKTLLPLGHSHRRRGRALRVLGPQRMHWSCRKGLPLTGFTEDTPIKPRRCIYLYDDRGCSIASVIPPIDTAYIGIYVRKGDFLGW
jgi:hypothetical protein